MESQCFPLLLTVGLRGGYVSDLVDTGATCSLIDVDQCQIRELSRDGPRVKAVNGSRLQTWGCLDVEFQMVGTKVKHPMVVASNLPWKMILGIDFLRHFEICLDLSRNILTFDGKEIHVGSGEASEEDWALELHTVDPPGQVSRMVENTRELLSEEQQGRLKAMIDSHKLAFAWDGVPLGRTKIIQHRIGTQGAAPIKQHPRRLPVAYR
ncbi:unnamed protein product [Echinostoma caproni]|uniref:RVP domain-containing protein n=1 Tax=Echinostoma caproni TaxID=27848 RepID=A0A183B3J9_9TREM|nr:unnamed protein product [Echinostoma caproni]